MTERNPKLSVIVPIYNVEAYLSRCVDSILAQTFADYELILVDDGSPDDCGRICDEYANKDPRIRVVHKENGGLSDARNAGLDIAQGTYVGFVDSDDYVHPEMYQRLMELIEGYGADIAATGFANVDESGEVWNRYPLLPQEKVLGRKDYIDAFYPDNKWVVFASACNKLYRRELFHKLRYPKGKLYEDSFILLFLLEQCETVVVDHKQHYYYFASRAGSIMNDRYTQKKFQLIELGLVQYHFFIDKGIKNQQEYALEDYATKYMINFFAVYIGHKELKEPFKPYKKTFGKLFWKMIGNPYICNMKKLTIMMMYLNKKLAYRLCKKYFPECLPEFLRG